MTRRSAHEGGRPKSAVAGRKAELIGSRARTLAADQDHPGVRPAEADDIEIPADSRFFGKPLEAKEMIAEMQSMIGQA